MDASASGVIHMLLRKLVRDLNKKAQRIRDEPGCAAPGLVSRRPAAEAIENGKVGDDA